MARMARVVVPDIPHHVTQRGNRRQQVFFGEEDYAKYLSLLKQYCDKFSVEVWAYCLMPNHVHLILVPRTNDSLQLALSNIHRSYSRMVNFRYNWRGYLWQGRFASFPMDEPYTLAAARYIELNPVAAGLCRKAEQWQWSSAAAHLGLKDDDLLTMHPLAGMVNNWHEHLDQEKKSVPANTLKTHMRTGRPLGSDMFIEKIETLTGRQLKKRKPGPKPRN